MQTVYVHGGGGGSQQGEVADGADGAAIGKMWNCGMRKVKCGIQKCGKVCGMVGKTRNAE